MSALVWPTKDPDEVLDYKLDWTARLDGDTISPGSLTPDIVRADRVASERVGSLAVTYSDASLSNEDRRPVVTVIDDILSRLLGPTRGSLLFESSSRS